MPKYETINNQTLPKLREALGNLLGIRDLTRESMLVADGMVVYIAQKVEEGTMYNIPVVTEEQNIHIDSTNLIINLKDNDPLVVTFFVFLVKSVVNIKNKKTFNIERVTPEVLDEELNQYRLV